MRARRSGRTTGAGEMTNGPAQVVDGQAEGGQPARRPRRVAAIDCGTNSLRLLIADVDPALRMLTDIDRRMEIVRLGQGVDATGRLAPEALARTFLVLEQYAHAIKESGVRGPESIRIVATSATRDAANADEFSRGVDAILGVEPEVISGQREAFLSFTGATTELASAGTPAGRLRPPYLVVDIGGGSTEFVLGGAAVAGGTPGGPGRLDALSEDIGCVRLTERHLRSDPPTPAETAAAAASIDAALTIVADRIAVASARTLVGLAGSVTTLTAIALGLPSYDAARVHHARISAARVHAVTAGLLSQTRAERARIPVLHPGRIDVIGAGALILDRIMIRFGFAEMVASEHDILDGIAWSIAAAPR
jgi:exopolyphosphatase / guanosine-5'-triphosphate,3'-diphosphate pyrophosphatase